jgi:hypothetical protein
MTIPQSSAFASKLRVDDDLAPSSGYSPTPS